LLLLAIAIGRGVNAQTLAPELAPIAAKYKTDLATLEAQRTAALTQAQTPYMTALASAEKTATAAGKVAGVAAIGAERAAIPKGLMTPGFPADLPKELQAARKTYLDAVARIKTAEAPRRQALDSAYLRALAGLAVKAPKESELSKQVEAEKQKLVASAPATAPKKVNSKNVIINGTFDTIGAGGQPSGWTLEEAYQVQKEGTNNILHASSKMPNFHAMTQDILIPARARNVTLSGRVRGKIVARDASKLQGPPGLFVAAVFLDKSEVPTTNWMMLDGGSDEKWKDVTLTQRIPDNMKVLQVALTLKNVSGEFDFDDIEVEFR
jgi:hypothetical protein